MQSVKYLTKETLRELLVKQVEWSLNRQINESDVEEFIAPQPDNTRYPLILFMLHEHQGGARVEPHYRCQLVLSEVPDISIVDVPMDFYDRLPNAEVSGD